MIRIIIKEWEYGSKRIFLKVHFRHWRNGLPVYIQLWQRTQGRKPWASYTTLQPRQRGKARLSFGHLLRGRLLYSPAQCHALRALPRMLQACHWLTQPLSPPFVTLTSLVNTGPRSGFFSRSHDLRGPRWFSLLHCPGPSAQCVPGAHTRPQRCS